MAKVQGFLSQDVEKTEVEIPGESEVTMEIPPSWIPLLEKVIRWYDNQIYPVWTPFGMFAPRKKKEVNRKNTFLSTLKLLWGELDDATKVSWGAAAAFVQRSGYQLFIKDTSYRLKTFRPFPRAPNLNFAMYGIKLSNPDGVGNVRLQRDDVTLTGPTTLSFNYRKTERAPTGGNPFGFTATLYYFADGLIQTETHVWSAPAGDVVWTSVSETYGTAGRRYFHSRVVFNLDDYDAEVDLANFLIQDETLSWTVDYSATVLPEDDGTPWAKVGDLTTIYIYGDRLYLDEIVGSTNSVEYTRTPSFDNTIGSSVKFRLKIEEGTEKDSGNDQYTVRVVHADGTRRAEYLFYQNGIILKLGDVYHKYHYDTTKLHTYTSYIRGDRLYFYVGRTLAFRQVITTAGGQEVLFGHYGRVDNDGESVWSFFRYYQGKDEAPGEDVIREGWLFRAGEEWEVDELYRKEGWSFTPSYTTPYFQVAYLG